MSSTGQATSSTSNIQLIIDDALADYAKITGIDLSDTPFATTLEQSNLEDIIQLLQGREKAFKEYRDGDRRLIGYLSPAVKVLQAFFGIIGEAASLASHTTNPSIILLM
jgi:fungal STAND N-terminal Goodbye domain